MARQQQQQHIYKMQQGERQADQQQQQQHIYTMQQGERQADQQQQQQRRLTSRPQRHPPPRWLLLPRSLSLHSFQLFDPATGAVAFTGSKPSSSYVAWRTADIVTWYKGLDEPGRAAVQRLLTDISTAGQAAAAAAGGCHGSTHAVRAWALSGRGAASTAAAATFCVVNAVTAFAEVAQPLLTGLSSAGSWLASATESCASQLLACWAAGRLPHHLAGCWACQQAVMRPTHRAG
jgi:hypothetical protein